MRVGLIALLGCLGCDRVFGLDRPDVPPLVLDAAPCRGPGEKIVLPLVADTYLDPGDNAPHGDSSIVRVGDGRTALLRFAAGGNALQELALKLTNATSAVECGSGNACASCSAGTAGELAVHLMRPDWDEATATQVQRTETEPWTTPGAAGTESSAALCSVKTFDGFDLSCKFMFAATDLAAEWTGDLSVQIRAVATASGVFGSRDGLDLCDQTPVARAIATCRAVATCGNNVTDDGEGCDDGNTSNGDGCSDGCALETLMPICGNGRLETGESCDDTNTTPGDGCAANCTIEPVCGNHVVDPGEACDDGNAVDNDACRNNCSCGAGQCQPS